MYADVPPPSDDDGIYELRLKMDALAELSIEIFGDVEHATPRPN